jgi:hypothetical protein
VLLYTYRSPLLTPCAFKDSKDGKPQYLSAGICQELHAASVRFSSVFAAHCRTGSYITRRRLLPGPPAKRRRLPQSLIAVVQRWTSNAWSEKNKSSTCTPAVSSSKGIPSPTRASGRSLQDHHRILVRLPLKTTSFPFRAQNGPEH